MILAGWALAAAFFAAPLAAMSNDRQACPPGWSRVPTREPDEPFHCRRQMDPGTPFIEMKANYKLTHCPKGFSPVATPGELQRFRCVQDKPTPTGEPDVAPVLTAPREAGKTSRSAKTQAAPAVLEYTRHELAGVLQFDYPKDWHLTDAWNDAVPTLYIEYDTGRQGKQPTLVISRYAQGQEGWVDMQTAISQEVEFQNSKEGAPLRVGGLPARQTSVERDSRSVYVNAGDSQYYLLSYSAAEDVFPAYEPAFKRLVATFRLSRRSLEAR